MIDKNSDKVITLGEFFQPFSKMDRDQDYVISQAEFGATMLNTLPIACRPY